ncbi:MAG: tetratricopeptide repeat protein, partial [Alphaproteobacteria bacterium]|nr:tetratricopeptide repeat protein [Alphaproteobacteria bacterium]
HRPAPPLPTLRRAAAEALIAPAGVMVTQKSDDVAMAYLRLALRLDPTRDEAWILVGDVLAAEGDTAAAHAAYARPGPNSPNYVEGQLKLAWAEQEAGNTDKALARVRALAGAHPHDREVAISLADILRAGGRYPDSIKLLDTLISTEGEVQDWRLLYMRADDEQESGDWPAAERDLKRALILQPNEPELLNFLGYSWIDRGERLNEALDMIKRAVALDPHSGAMIDSLGWGYYRLGDYAEAVKQLEAAVLLEPGDPDINDHLGDAYWRAGRKLEAQFQWRRVLSLDPSAKLKAQAEAKLKDGLGEPSAAPLKTSDPRPSVVAVTRQTPS